MIPRSSRRLWALALALVASGWVARAAQATPIQYSTAGVVGAPESGAPGLLYYNGLNNSTFTPPNLNLGQFVLSPLAGSAGATFNNTPFLIFLSAGGTQSETINGVINGSVGPAATNPSLTATITSVAPMGGDPLPFTLSLPMNTPLKLSATTDGVNASPTGITVAASPVPEPASVAVFAVTLGGLALWRRRRPGR